MVSMRSLMAYFLRDTPRVWYFFACCLVILVLSYKCRDIQAVSFDFPIACTDLSLY